MCAAVPLCAQVRNVEGGVHGRHELDTTGPLLAGACLRKPYRTMGNFSMHVLTTAPWMHAGR